MGEGLFKKRLKKAFWNEFHASGERWFTYFGTDKEQTEDTNFVWENMNMGAIVDEARKEICEAIQQHISELLDFWKSKPDPQRQKVAQYYIDAYLCIKHNILDRDKFKLKKWFGEP